jgi:flagellar motor switch protein FliM
MIHTELPQAVGRAAMHCDELMRRTRSVADLDVAFARLARDLAEQSNVSLSKLCNDQSVSVEAVETGYLAMSEWLKLVGTAHQHSLFSVAKGKRGILVSVSIGELAAQFERLLGGTGEVDQNLASLPASALRFAQQFEQGIAETLWRTTERPGVNVLDRGDEVDQVAPFPKDESIWTASLAVRSEHSAQTWKIRIAADEATVADLVGVPAEPTAKGPSIGECGLENSAIADVQLPLRAVLVDMGMSVARLANIDTGSLIPVALNRNVPVLTGELKIAQGCIGEVDDRVALEISQSFLKGAES